MAWAAGVVSCCSVEPLQCRAVAVSILNPSPNPIPNPHHTQVGGYFFLCLTVYAAIISSTANHGSWDASVIHNNFSRRRYFLATLTPGLVAQYALEP